MEIIWTDTALETFLKVIDYLSNDWTLREVEEFELKVDQIIERIISFKQMCPESKLFGYKKCVIDKNNSIVYHIVNNKLLIITFIDNRSEHSF